jgi:hypothetical protein
LSFTCIDHSAPSSVTIDENIAEKLAEMLNKGTAAAGNVRLLSDVRDQKVLDRLEFLQTEVNSLNARLNSKLEEPRYETIASEPMEFDYDWLNSQLEEFKKIISESKKEDPEIRVLLEGLDSIGEKIVLKQEPLLIISALISSLSLLTISIYCVLLYFYN